MKARINRGGPRSGFTFIEIMLVVAMIAVLASVVAVSMGGRKEKANVAAATSTIAALSTAIDLYEIDAGSYPATLNELQSDSGKKGWDGPYLKKETTVPDDPWGNPYNYATKEKGYDLSSSGKDGQSGTEDDVK